MGAKCQIKCFIKPRWK